MLYRLADGVRFVMTEGDTAYLERGGDKFTVSGAGIQFLKLLDGIRDMDEILEELVKMYGPNVEPYVLARDLEKFMLALSSEGLVVLVKSHFDSIDMKNIRKKN